MDNLSEIGKYPFLLFNNRETTKNASLYFDTYKNVVSSAAYDDEYYEIIKSVFFSEENIGVIQRMIRKTVFERSNYNIVPQNQDHLLNIMMDIYKAYCKNLPFNIKEQVMELNQHVVDHVYPYIVKQIDAIYKYRREIEGPIGVMPLPQNTSIQGQKTLPAFR